MKRYTLEQIAGELKIDLARIKEWVEGGVVVPSHEGTDEFFVEEDLERFRIIRNLTDDLEVNAEGVEVILPMRDKMISMEKWIRAVFKILGDNNLLTDKLIEEFKKF